MLKDLRTRYGLISILLHWSTAAVVIVMLAVGSAIASREGNVAHLLSVHTGLAVLAYPLLASRIAWRLRCGHPDALPRQNPRLVGAAKLAHYTMIAILAAMLLSGPLMAWAGGFPIHIFGFGELPAPWKSNAKVFAVTHRVHAVGGTALIVLVIGHITAAVAHMIFKRDGTLDKMLMPPRSPT